MTPPCQTGTHHTQTKESAFLAPANIRVDTNPHCHYDTFWPLQQRLNRHKPLKKNYLRQKNTNGMQPAGREPDLSKCFIARKSRHLSFNSPLSQYPGSGKARFQNQSINKMQYPRYRIEELRTEVSEERRHGSLGRKNHRY